MRIVITSNELITTCPTFYLFLLWCLRLQVFLYLSALKVFIFRSWGSILSWPVFIYTLQIEIYSLQPSSLLSCCCNHWAMSKTNTRLINYLAWISFQWKLLTSLVKMVQFIFVIQAPNSFVIQFINTNAKFLFPSKLNFSNLWPCLISSFLYLLKGTGVVASS